MIGIGSWKTLDKILPGVYSQVLSSEPIDLESTLNEITNSLLVSSDGFLFKTADDFYLTIQTI